MRKSIVILLVLSLSACGGGGNPANVILGDVFDIDIRSFSLSTNQLNPGDTVNLRWRVDTIFRFNARFYLSDDENISSDDILFIDEECAFDNAFRCEPNVDIEFVCVYGNNDNSFNCSESQSAGGSSLSTNDISNFLATGIPKTAFIIFQACDTGDRCRTSLAQSIRFL